MRNLQHLDEFRVKHPFAGFGDEYNGVFLIKNSPLSHLTFKVIASSGLGWDHVSVSTEDRCPRWNEMCYIKDLFFGEEEAVMQLHPAKSAYVNNHPFCLHLWRPHNEDIPLPDIFMV